MGISGFLTLVKSVHQQVHISEYAGKTVAVDGNVWLHKGAFACALDLALQRETKKYVEYFIRQVELLEFYGVIPYIVFDGAPLPIKAVTNEERQRRREEARAKGRECLALGKQQEAEEWFQRAVEVTPAMVQQVKKVLDEKKVKNVIAPYEADAQLTYLMKTNRADAVITEDSDLLVFGCHTVIFKMDAYGDGIRIRYRDLASAKEIDLRNWDEKAIRHLCIFSGCDYLPSLPGVGLKVAYKLLKKFRTAESVLQRFKIQGRFKHIPDYEQAFKRADQAFLYQYVYDPDIKQRVHLNVLPAGILPESLDFLGTDGHTHNDASATGDNNDSQQQQQQPVSPSSSTDTPAASPSSDGYLAGSSDTSSIQQQSVSLSSRNSPASSPSSDGYLAGTSDPSSDKSIVSLTTEFPVSSSSSGTSDEKPVPSVLNISTESQASSLSDDTSAATTKVRNDDDSLLPSRDTRPNNSTVSPEEGAQQSRRVASSLMHEHLLVYCLENKENIPPWARQDKDPKKNKNGEDNDGDHREDSLLKASGVASSSNTGDRKGQKRTFGGTSQENRSVGSSSSTSNHGKKQKLGDTTDENTVGDENVPKVARLGPPRKIGPRQKLTAQEIFERFNGLSRGFPSAYNYR